MISLPLRRRALTTDCALLGKFLFFKER
ncbi:hypothetical protein NC653_006288 [Populus alba x Populus x berolinensis]|uniref:Uncharacterized protein n=1 Tax=Populus alba x Populus x berolinensis TaxID=444605 RepID=A0AAD6WC01_9ROSI|nr:hypothetical protein NC653_006288 [Populus alba x Populus x berolinensis]